MLSLSCMQIMVRRIMPGGASILMSPIRISCLAHETSEVSDVRTTPSDIWPSWVTRHSIRIGISAERVEWSHWSGAELSLGAVGSGSLSLLPPADYARALPCVFPLVFRIKRRAVSVFLFEK